MSQHLDVFVSSTSEDLREYRAAVKAAIENLGLYPIMMERFPAEGASAVSACKRYLGEAEIYVGIYAHRYGWIPTPEQGGRDRLSITALEYEWAKARDLPLLCFLVDPNQPWTPKWIEAEPGKPLLDAFKARVSGETIRKEFTTPDNLASLVKDALFKAVLDLTGQAPTPGGWRRPVPPLLAHNFVGRAEDRTALRALLCAEGDPVVVVRGAGGIGKTYFATQVARDLADEFPGGVLWAGLGPNATMPDSVLASVLPEWVCPHPTGRSLPPEKLTPGLVRSLLGEAEGRLLAVLDDAWAAEPIRALQQALPAGTACLITTRSPRIAALGGHNHTLNKLSEADGCALLDDRLRASGADPAPYAGPLREIVARLDGHALALDLAARQLAEQGIHTAPRFVEKLDRHLGGQSPFKLLDLGRGETREDSLEAALYLSYAPLSEDAQAKFRALGAIAPDVSFADRTIFATWGVEPHPLTPSPWKNGEGEKRGAQVPFANSVGEGDLGVEAVSRDESGADPLEAAEDALAELIRWGLVERLPNTDRCAQHLLLHAYAAALARRADEYDPALGRYTKHVIRDIAGQFDDLPLQEWDAKIMPDQDQVHHVGNMLAGYLRVVVLGEMPLEALAQPEAPAALPEIDPGDRMAAALLERSEDFAAAVYGYVFHRSMAEEGRRWLWMGLACARLRENREREGLFLNQLGLWHRSRGYPAAALAYYEASLPIAREVGDRAGEAATLNNMGVVYDSTGQPQRALDYYEQALPIRREVGDRAGEAATLNNIGTVYDSTGQPQRALDYFEQALPIRREVGDRAGEASTLNNMGVVYDSTGQPQRALDYYEQALPIRREVGDRAGEASTLNNMGEVYRTTGQPERALEYYEQALPIMREVGNRAIEAVALNNIGEVYRTTGQPQRALDCFEQALPILHEVGDRAGEAATLNNMAVLHYQQGEPQRTAEMLRQVIQIFHEIGAVVEEAALLFNMAYVLHRSLWQTAEAVELVTRAIALLEQYHLPQSASGRTVAEYRAFLEQMQQSRPPAR